MKGAEPVRVQTPGRFAVALALNGHARVLVAVIPDQAEELRVRHNLDRAATVLAAEGLVASLLLSAHIKGEERMTVQVASEKPPFSFTADVDAAGVLRARFTPAQGIMPVKKFTGMLLAMKSLGQHEIYRGVSPVMDETFEQALGRFLTQSQQTDARVRVLCRLDKRGHVRFAAGLFVERMPGASAEEFAAAFDETMAPGTGSAAKQQTDFEKLINDFAMGQLAGAPVELLGFQDFLFRCSCTQERVGGMLRALGLEELRSIREEQGRAEVTCNYCNERYEFDGPALDTMMVGLTPAS